MRRGLAWWREPMTLLAIHNAVFTLGLAMAGGFIGAYLLRLGLPAPVVILLCGSYLLVRFSLRVLALALVRRMGLRRAMVLGAVVIALQFAPLSQAVHPAWLILWLLCAAMGESLYWPIYHAATAAIGRSEKRGRDLGLRAALTALGSVFGPLVGGVILAKIGPDADFALAGLILIAALLPLLRVPPCDMGRVPRLRDVFQGLDATGLIMFAADGWITACWVLAWGVAYFLLLGSHYEAFGAGNAAAGVVGLVCGLWVGGWIDRKRHDGWQLAWIAMALLGCIGLRGMASWVPALATFANLAGTAVNALYLPLLMSAIYERAKRSGGILRFHQALEGAWDVGYFTGSLAAAAVAWLVPGRISLAVLPAALGVLVFALCMRADKRHLAAAASTG